MPNQYSKELLYNKQCLDLDNMYCKCNVCNSARQHQYKKYADVDIDTNTLLESDFFDLIDDGGKIKDLTRFI